MCLLFGLGLRLHLALPLLVPLTTHIAHLVLEEERVGVQTVCCGLIALLRPPMSCTRVVETISELPSIRVVVRVEGKEVERAGVRQRG